MATNRTWQHGFTLIELLVVIAIVSILAAIAIPSFQGQIRKSRRTEAITALQDAQLKLERWRVDHASYEGSSVGSQFPASVYYSYTLTAAAATPNNYSITATPQGGQAKDSCGTLTISKAVGVISTSATGTGNCG